MRVVPVALSLVLTGFFLPAEAVPLPLVEPTELGEGDVETKVPASGHLVSTSVADRPARPTVGAARPTARLVADRPARPTARRRQAPRTPPLRVARPVRGLAQPWDVQPIGGGRWLITERDRRTVRLWNGRRLHTVRFPRRSVAAFGETGLMSLEVDPGFRRNRRIYTCQGGHRRAGGRDVRVVAWRLSRDNRRLTRVRNLLTRIQATSGRHGGCRLLITRKGALLVGTGDAAVGRNPQNRRSFNGKVLRIRRMTGAPWPHNPWPRAQHRRKRYVLTYGHRNVQGLAQRRDGTLWSVEHGSWRDDEVNRLFRGGNYGWNPVPGYNEQRPMTDHRLPGRQRSARWRSGRPTIATSGAAWVHGRQWGNLNGTLAVAALKGSRVVFMKFGPRGALRWTFTPPRLRRDGRLRSVTSLPGGDLLVTTANGRRDKVLRVSPIR